MWVFKDLLFMLIGFFLGWLFFSPIEGEEDGGGGEEIEVPPFSQARSPLMRAAVSARSPNGREPTVRDPTGRDPTGRDPT